MGLLDALRRKRDHVIADQVSGAVKDALSDAAAGKDGPMAETIVNAVLNHKAAWGGFLTYLAGLFSVLEKGHPGHGLDVAAEVCMFTGGYLVSMGAVRSDTDRRALTAAKENA